MLPPDGAAAADVVVVVVEDDLSLLVGGVGNSWRLTARSPWSRGATTPVGGVEGSGSGTVREVFSCFFCFFLLLLVLLLLLLLVLLETQSCFLFLFLEEEQALAAADDDDDDDGKDELPPCTSCCCRCCSSCALCSTRFCKSITCERTPSFDHSSSSWGKSVSASFAGTAWGCPIMAGVINSKVSSNSKIASSNLGDGGWVSIEELESSLT